MKHEQWPFGDEMRAFGTRQEALKARVENGEARFVRINPDGTSLSWLGVVIETESGVIYGMQCAGTYCEQRFVEGYFIPLGGMKMLGEERIDTKELTAPFSSTRQMRFWRPRSTG